MNNVTRNPDGKPPRAGFRLDKTNAKVFGVCAGIADYFGIAATLLGFGSPILIYLAIALIAD
jgi:phage shock protein PspC (stress-responsive transcriptional regulator)